MHSNPSPCALNPSFYLSSPCERPGLGRSSNHSKLVSSEELGTGPQIFPSPREPLRGPAKELKVSLAQGLGLELQGVCPISLRVDLAGWDTSKLIHATTLKGRARFAVDTTRQEG